MARRLPRYEEEEGASLGEEACKEDASVGVGRRLRGGLQAGHRGGGEEEG